MSKHFWMVVAIMWSIGIYGLIFYQAHTSNDIFKVIFCMLVTLGVIGLGTVQKRNKEK